MAFGPAKDHPAHEHLGKLIDSPLVSARGENTVEVSNLAVMRPVVGQDLAFRATACMY